MTTTTETTRLTGTHTLQEYIESLTQAPWRVEDRDTYICWNDNVAVRDGEETTWPAGTIVYSPSEWGSDGALHKDFTSERPALRSARLRGGMTPLVRTTMGDLVHGDLVVIKFGERPRNYLVVVNQVRGLTFDGWMLIDGRFYFDRAATTLTMNQGMLDRGSQQVWRVPLTSHVSQETSDAEAELEAVVGDDATTEATVEIGTAAHEAVENARITELEAEVQRLRDENSATLRQWREEMLRLGEHLIEAANDNDLCSVYDRTIEYANVFLRYPLPAREREHEVTWEITGETAVPVNDGAVEVEVEVSWRMTHSQTVSTTDDPSDVDFEDYFDRYAVDWSYLEVTDIDAGSIEDHTVLAERVRENMTNDDWEVEVTDIESA